MISGSGKGLHYNQAVTFLGNIWVNLSLHLQKENIESFVKQSLGRHLISHPVDVVIAVDTRHRYYASLSSRSHAHALTLAHAHPRARPRAAHAQVVEPPSSRLLCMPLSGAPSLPGPLSSESTGLCCGRCCATRPHACSDCACACGARQAEPLHACGWAPHLRVHCRLRRLNFHCLFSSPTQRHRPLNSRLQVSYLKFIFSN